MEKIIQVGDKVEYRVPYDDGTRNNQAKVDKVEGPNVYVDWDFEYDDIDEFTREDIVVQGNEYIMYKVFDLDWDEKRQAWIPNRFGRS